MKRPDTTQMRKELAANNVVVKCTRPGWEARRDSDGFLVTSSKMKFVISQAYDKLKGRK